MRRLLALLDLVSMALAAFAAFLTLSIAVVIISEIIARSFFNYSFSFAWEYSAYAMGAAMFCGLAYTLRTGGHIRVSLLAAALPEAISKAVDVLCTLIAIGFSGYISLALCELAWSSFVSGSTAPSVTATPLIIPQGLIALGAVFLTLQFVARLIRLVINEEPEDKSTSYLAE